MTRTHEEERLHLVFMSHRQLVNVEHRREAAVCDLAVLVNRREHLPAPVAILLISGKTPIWCISRAVSSTAGCKQVCRFKPDSPAKEEGFHGFRPACALERVRGRSATTKGEIGPTAGGTWRPIRGS